MRNVKNSAFFFIKSIVYLKSYINFDEIIKVKAMKTRNWTIETLDFIKGTGILDLNLGKGKIMELQFEVQFERDGDEIEQVDVKLTPYTIHNEDGILKHGILNKRNTNLICEMLEEIIISDPCSYGFETMQEEFDYYQELTFEERRLSNI